MSLNAATIEILLAKGLTGQDLLEVARATEVKADRTNAERQARHRRKRNAVTVTDVAPKEDTSNLVPSEPEGSTGTKSVRKKSIPVEVPAWMPAEPWAAFVEMRRGMRGVPFTEAAKRGIIADLERFRAEGHDIAAILTTAVNRGYRGVFAPDKPAGQPLSGPKPMNSEQLRAAIRYAEDNDDPDRAAECRQMLAKLRTDYLPPPVPIQRIISQAANGMRARG